MQVHCQQSTKWSVRHFVFVFVDDMLAHNGRKFIASNQGLPVGMAPLCEIATKLQNMFLLKLVPRG